MDLQDPAFLLACDAGLRVESKSLQELNAVAIHFPGAA